VILQQHRIPFRNLFSFTYPDHPDPDLAWGFQVMVALLYRLTGFSGLVLGKVMLVVVAAGLTLWTCDKAGASRTATLLALVVAGLASVPRMVERPHLMTFIGIAALQAWLHSRRRPLPLLVGVVVWANFHAGVFFAPLILLANRIGERLDGEPGTRRDGWTMAGVCVASLASPGGWRLPRYLLWHTGIGSSRIVDEFRVADPWNDPFFFVMLCAILAALLLRRWCGWRRLLPVFLVAVLAWRSVRFVAEWAFLAAPTLALLLSWKAEPGWLSQIAAALTAAWVTISRIASPTGIGLDPEVVPFTAIHFATEQGLRTRMYSDFDVGCYLLWEGWPKYSVFQDARLPAYPDEFHRALDQTDLAPRAFDALLQKYGVDSALISDPAINIRSGSFSPDVWALVYKDADALIFARRSEEHAEVIRRFEIPLRVTFNFVEGTRYFPLAPRQ
jgi:hypothetical protein